MHPILFRIGPLTIHTYGVLVATGFFLGLGLAMKTAGREGIGKEQILDLGFFILIAALVGSRLLFVITEWRYYLKNPIGILKLWEGGLVFYGGLLLAIPVAIFYIRRHSLPLWKTADIFAPAIAIGHSIGRLGCFAAGCCYGKPTDLPWAVTFSNPECLTPKGVPLHPTQLYESIGEFAIFIVLMITRRAKSFDGQLFWLYVMLYAPLRFLVEFFRGDDIRGFIYGRISVSQGISAIVFPIAVFVFLMLRIENKKKDKKEVEG